MRVAGNIQCDPSVSILTWAWRFEAVLTRLKCLLVPRLLLLFFETYSNELSSSCLISTWLLSIIGTYPINLF